MGDVVLVHESLCEGLGALHLCSDGRGAKDGDADLAESEFDAIDKGLFGAGEAEVDAVLDSPGGDFAKVARGLGRVDVGASRAEGGGAAVAGSAEDVLYAVGAEEVVCDGMFATAGAEDEDAGEPGGEHGLERDVEGSGSHLGTFGQRLGVVVHGTPLGNETSGTDKWRLCGEEHEEDGWR